MHLIKCNANKLAHHLAFCDRKGGESDGLERNGADGMNAKSKCVLSYVGSWLPSVRRKHAAERVESSRVVTIGRTFTHYTQLKLIKRVCTHRDAMHNNTGACYTTYIYSTMHSMQNNVGVRQRTPMAHVKNT